MDYTTKKELQSATFERLIQHLRERKDVQNLDLMNKDSSENIFLLLLEI